MRRLLAAHPTGCNLCLGTSHHGLSPALFYEERQWLTNLSPAATSCALSPSPPLAAPSSRSFPRRPPPTSTRWCARKRPPPRRGSTLLNIFPRRNTPR